MGHWGASLQEELILLHCKLATIELTGKLHYKRSSYFFITGKVHNFYIVNWPLMIYLDLYLADHAFTL